MDHVFSYYDYIGSQYEAYDDYFNSTLEQTYNPPRNVNDFTPPLFLFICIIAFLSLIWCFVFCYKICKVLRTKTTANETFLRISSLNASSSSSKTSLILTIACIICFTLQNLLDPLAYFTHFIQYNARTNTIFYMLYNLCWIGAKLSFYLILIHRYYLIFDASYLIDPYLKQKKVFMFGTFLFIVFSQIIVYFCYFLVYYEFIDDDLSNFETIQISTLIFLIFDIFLISLLIYLFISSMIELAVQIQRKREKNANHILCLNSIDETMSFQTTTTIAPQMSTKLDENEECDETFDTVTSLKSFPTSLKPKKPRNSYTASHSGSHFHVAKLSNLSIISDIEYDRDLYKTNINLNASEITDSPTQNGDSANSNTKLHRFDTTDIQNSYDYDHFAHDCKHIAYTPPNDREYDAQQLTLLNMATRMAMMSFVVMISGLFYQSIWLIGYEFEWRLVWFNYTWCLDGIISIFCVYMQCDAAKPMYKRLFIDGCCKLHRFGFGVIGFMMRRRTKFNHRNSMRFRGISKESADLTGMEMNVMSGGMGMTEIGHCQSMESVEVTVKEGSKDETVQNI